MHVVVSLFKFQNILIKGSSLTVITNVSGYDVIYVRCGTKDISNSNNESIHQNDT